MTLQSDFTANLNFLSASDYKAASQETTKSRARIISAVNASRPAAGAKQENVAVLLDAAAVLQSGDQGAMEPALAAQVAALDAIFREYAKMAAVNTDILSVQTYMRFALKAQAQCRVTVETLERIRSARAPAAGPAASREPTEEVEKSTNELLANRFAVFEPALDSEKSPNELLRSRLLGGVSASGFSPPAAAELPEPQNSANELLEADDGLRR